MTMTNPTMASNKEVIVHKTVKTEVASAAAAAGPIFDENDKEDYKYLKSHYLEPYTSKKVLPEGIGLRGRLMKPRIIQRGEQYDLFRKEIELLQDQGNDLGVLRILRRLRDFDLLRIPFPVTATGIEVSECVDLTHIPDDDDIIDVDDPQSALLGATNTARVKKEEEEPLDENLPLAPTIMMNTDAAPAGFGGDDTVTSRGVLTSLGNNALVGFGHPSFRDALSDSSPENAPVKKKLVASTNSCRSLPLSMAAKENGQVKKPAASTRSSGSCKPPMADATKEGEAPRAEEQ